MRHATAFALRAGPRWGGVAFVVWGCLWAAAASAAPAQPWPDVAGPQAASLWPRVFYTPQQRADMQEARKRPPSAADAPQGTAAAPLPAPTYSLEGLAYGHKNATAWINGQMLQQGEHYADRTVHIEADLVRLRQPGQSDIVLRPGQQAGEDGALQHDVIPAGNFQRKKGSSAR